MANTAYNVARVGFATKQIDWVSDDIRLVLVDTTIYTFDATHDALNDIPVGARIVSAAMASRTVSAVGGCKAANNNLAGVTGNYVGAVVLYKQGGTEATSPLLLYMDTLSGIPFTPSGGAVLLSWNASDTGILRA